jgi:hypothetical protein
MQTEAPYRYVCTHLLLYAYTQDGSRRRKTDWCDFCLYSLSTFRGKKISGLRIHQVFWQVLTL